MAHRILGIGLAMFLGVAVLPAADPDVLRIGFVNSILDESPASARALFAKEFSGLVKDFTGLKSVVTKGINPETSAKQLEDGKWHLGVFHGVEFAWIQAKHPALKPLMVTTTRVSPLRAVLMARKDSGVTGIGDLKGKNVSLLKYLHCKLFEEKLTAKADKFFSNVVHMRSVEDALDDVLSGKVQGAFVDTPTLAFYKELQPGRFERLKIVAESEAFPPALIVYRPGNLTDKMLKQVKDGMFKVKETQKGREALHEFKITGFEVVPADIQQSLTKILKAYPAPEF